MHVDNMSTWCVVAAEIQKVYNVNNLLLSQSEMSHHFCFANTEVRG
jgi:hypothetical protein